MRLWRRQWALCLALACNIVSALAGAYDDFFIAIKQDNPRVIQQLLARGFDPNTVNPAGEYALLWALREDASKVVPVLLAHPSTRVEVRNAHDESPLMLAALKGQLAICKQLIARDADVNKPGWTPLHYAATGGHREVMALLLQHHAYIDAPSPNGSTPLMLAAMYASPEAVTLLLDAGADAQLKNTRGLSALDFAHQGQRPDAVRILQTHLRKQQTPAGW